MQFEFQYTEKYGKMNLYFNNCVRGDASTLSNRFSKVFSNPDSPLALINVHWCVFIIVCYVYQD